MGEPVYLFPPLALEATARALSALQSEPYAWAKQPEPFSAHLSRAMQHLVAYQCGEHLDGDVHHLGAAIASLMILIDLETHHPHLDDRLRAPALQYAEHSTPPTPTSCRNELAAAQAVLDKPQPPPPSRRSLGPITVDASELKWPMAPEDLVKIARDRATSMEQGEP